MEPFELLDELRILTENGRRYADDPYDEERYERVPELVDEWYGHTVDRPSGAIRERFAEELGHVTPKLCADAALFDDEERILPQLRADDGRWGLPSGSVEPNESPAETAVREAVEETGLSVDVRQFIGVYTRDTGEYGPHCLVVHCISAPRAAVTSRPPTGGASCGTGTPRTSRSGTTITADSPVARGRPLREAERSP